MSQSPPGGQLCEWKALYIAALFENNNGELSERIAHAKSAILARRRELTLSVSDVRERHALDNALFSLEALRTCLSIAPPVLAGGLQRQVAGEVEGSPVSKMF